MPALRAVGADTLSRAARIHHPNAVIGIAAAIADIAAGIPPIKDLHLVMQINVIDINLSGRDAGTINHRAPAFQVAIGGIILQFTVEVTECDHARKIKAVHGLFEAGVLAVQIRYTAFQTICRDLGKKCCLHGWIPVQISCLPSA